LKRLTSTVDGQIICLLHGPGGSGKSTVINLLVAYAKEFCEHLGHPFTEKTIVVTAMSGVAATLIHGETTHKALGLNRSKLSQEFIQEWWDTRLVIIDEISFAGSEDVTKMDLCCRHLKRKMNSKYGGLNIVFAGDFSQLEPVGRPALYNGAICPQFHNFVNVFIELDGQHRFAEDPAWGNMMKRFREGEPTLDDIKKINRECLFSRKEPPKGRIQIASYYNKDRDSVNCELFEKFCEDNADSTSDDVLQVAVLIFMDQLEIRDSSKNFAPLLSNEFKNWFYLNCGENACKVNEHKAGRVDPVLKLYRNCPIMLTQNKNVGLGQANGSRLFFKDITTPPWESPILVHLNNGQKIRAYYASQIRHITVKQEAVDIHPSEFEVKPAVCTFRTKVQYDNYNGEISMKGFQFGLISNSATTGHKLQGYTAVALIVLNWEYKENWVYTVLSRIRTMKNLYIMKELSEDLDKYKMSPRMKQMMSRFQENVAVPYFEAHEYEKFLHEEYDIWQSVTDTMAIT